MFMLWSVHCAFVISYTQRRARGQRIQSLTTSLSACSSLCIYVILSVCNARYRNELRAWGLGSSLAACSNSRGVLRGAKWDCRCLASNASLETKLLGWRGHGTASAWNAPLWFKVQPPESEGLRDHLRPPTQVNSFTTSVHSSIPAWLCCKRPGLLSEDYFFDWSNCLLYNIKSVGKKTDYNFMNPKSTSSNIYFALLKVLCACGCMTFSLILNSHISWKINK